MHRINSPLVSKPALTLVALAIVEIAAAMALPSIATAAPGTTVEFQQEKLPLSDALLSIGRSAAVTVLFDPTLVQGYTAAPVRGSLTVEQALNTALQDTDLEWRQNANGSYTVVQKKDKTKSAERKPSVIELPGVVVAARRLAKGYAADSTGAATRTDTPLLELAQSVSTVSKELITDQQATSVIDALRNVSSISQDGITNAPNPQVMIRGFATGNSASDGLMSNGAFELYTPTIALEKVEVIKGPESIIGGTGAAFGGLINMVTKKPQAETSRQLQLGADSKGMAQLGIDVTGALNETKELRGRLIMSAQKNPDLDLDWNGGKDLYLAPTLAWKDSSNSLILGVEFQNYHRAMGNFAYSLGTTVDVNSLAIYHAPDDGIDYKLRRYHFDYERDLGDDLKIGLRGRYQTSSSRGTYWAQNPTSFPISAGDPLALLAYDQDVSFTTQTVQADVRKKLTWGITEHRLLAGIDYSNNKVSQTLGFKYDGGPENLVSFGTAGQTGIMPSVQGLANYFSVLPTTPSQYVESGVLLQDQIAIGEDWNVLLAARHVSYTPKLDSTAPSVSKLLPSLGVVFRPVPNVALYGSYSEGLDQTIGQTTRDGSALPPTQAKQVEVGVKQAYLDERLVLTTALFKTKKKNVPVADPDNSGFYHVQAGQESRGLEIELVGRLNPALNVSVAYTRALSADDDGNPLLGLAGNQINVWTQYRFLAGDWAGWNIAGGMTARSSVNYIIPFFNAYQRNPGNARFDAVVGYDAKSWGVKFGVRNIANRVLFTSGSTVGLAEVEQGRTLTLTGSYRF